MDLFSDGINGMSHPHGLLYDVQARLQTLLDKKEQQLLSAGSLARHDLAQQVGLDVPVPMSVPVASAAHLLVLPRARKATFSSRQSHGSNFTSQRLLF